MVLTKEQKGDLKEDPTIRIDNDGRDRAIISINQSDKDVLVELTSAVIAKLKTHPQVVVDCSIAANDLDLTNSLLRALMRASNTSRASNPEQLDSNQPKIVLRGLTSVKKMNLELSNLGEYFIIED